MTPGNFPFYWVAAPEIVLLGLICVVLLADLFVEDDRRVITYWLAMLSLAVTMITIFSTNPGGREVVFSGSYVSDSLSHVLKIAVTGFVGLVFPSAIPAGTPHSCHDVQCGVARAGARPQCGGRVRRCHGLGRVRVVGPAPDSGDLQPGFGRG